MQSIELKIVFLVAVVVLSGPCMLFAEELDIESSVSKRLLEKTTSMENQRKSSAPASQDYKSGFDDGYNQAIMDLVKSKLLNDPTVKPSLRQVPLSRDLMQPLRETNRQVQTLVPDPAAIRTMPGPKLEPLPPITEESLAEPQQPISQPSVSQPAVSSPQSISRDTQTQIQSQAPLSVLTEAIKVPTLPAPVAQDNATPAQVSQPQETVQADPAMPWLEKSRGYLHKQEWSNAIDAASHAIVANAKNADGFIYRSWARAENGEYQEAIEDASKAIQIAGNNALAYNNRAYAYELAKSPDLAIMDYDFACKLGYQVACNTAKKLKRVNEESKQKVKQFTAQTANAFKSRNWGDVEQFASQVLAIDGNNTDAYINRAVARTELGKYGKALNDCNTALIINPKLGVAYNNKGYIFELLGETKKAELEYETACQLGIKQSCSDWKRLKKDL